MQNASEQFLNLAAPLAGILPHTDPNLTQELITRIVPNQLWETFQTTGNQHQFYSKNIILNEQQKLQQFVCKELNLLWDNAHMLESQGYQIQEFKIQFNLNSNVAQTQIACEIIANRSGGKFTISHTKTESCYSIESKTVSAESEVIPCIVAAARTDEDLSELPSNMVDALKEFLEKNPDYRDDEITELGMETRILPLFDISIKSNIFYNGNENLPQMIEDLSSMTLDATSSTSSLTTPKTSSLQVKELEKKMVSGLISNSVFISARKSAAPQPLLESGPNLSLS